MTSIPQPYSFNGQEPVQLQLRPIRHIYYCERYIDVSIDELMDFFNGKGKAGECCNLLSAGMLGAPLEFDLERVVVTFLTRMPKCILEELCDNIEIEFTLGIIPRIEAKLSVGQRYVVPSDQLNISRSQMDSNPWNEDGRSFVFSTMVYDPEPSPTRIHSLEHIGCKLVHKLIREDIPRFLVRVSMEGVLWAAI